MLPSARALEKNHQKWTKNEKKTKFKTLMLHIQSKKSLIFNQSKDI